MGKHCTALQEIKALVDDGKYFTINKARQYGKTTTLIALKRLLESEYYVVLMDFQTFGSADFANEKRFCTFFLSFIFTAVQKMQTDIK